MSSETNSADAERQSGTDASVGIGAGAGAGAGAAASAAEDESKASAPRRMRKGGKEPVPPGGITDALIVRNTPTEKKRNESASSFVSRITHLNLMGKKITQITNLLQCHALRVLYLYDNQISELTGLPATLTHLHLTNNRIQRMENMSHLKRLSKLYLEHNEIAKVEGLESCRELEELHISNQRLPKGTELTLDYASLEAIGNSLRVLMCSGNRMTTVVPLALLGGLSKADLSKNNLQELKEVEPFLKYTPFLTQVDFRGNPVTKARKYRDHVILASRSVSSLDNKKVEKNQREFLHRFQAHKKSRPTKAQKAAEDAKAAAQHDAMSAGLPKKASKYAPPAKLGSRPGARAVGAGGFMAAPRGRGGGRGASSLGVGVSGSRVGRR